MGKLAGRPYKQRAGQTLLAHQAPLLLAAGNPDTEAAPV
jgi:hypothetical protein